MSTATKSATKESLEIRLPPHLIVNFEKADRELTATYGVSPGVTALVRLWTACATSWQIRQEFESACLDITHRTIQPNAEGEFDESCL